MQAEALEASQAAAAQTKTQKEQVAAAAQAAQAKTKPPPPPPATTPSAMEATLPQAAAAAGRKSAQEAPQRPGKRPAASPFDKTVAETDDDEPAPPKKKKVEKPKVEEPESSTDEESTDEESNDEESNDEESKKEEYLISDEIAEAWIVEKGHMSQEVLNGVLDKLYENKHNDVSARIIAKMCAMGLVTKTKGRMPKNVVDRIKKKYDEVLAGWDDMKNEHPDIVTKVFGITLFYKPKKAG